MDFPICLKVDTLHNGIWYGSMSNGAYFLKDYKHWLHSPIDYHGLTHTKHHIIIWSKTQISFYHLKQKTWTTITAPGKIKKIAELANAYFIQTEEGIFEIDIESPRILKSIQSSNTDHFFVLNDRIYWSNYFEPLNEYHPQNKKTRFNVFKDVSSVFYVESNIDFAIALTSNYKAFLLKDNEVTELIGDLPNNLNNSNIYFYGNLILFHENNQLWLYALKLPNKSNKTDKNIELLSSFDLTKISLDPITWIRSNQHGLWILMGNTLVQLGVNAAYPKLSLISEYYLGQSINSVNTSKNHQFHLSDDELLRSCGRQIEIHPLNFSNSLGIHANWDIDFQNFKVFKEDLLPSIREGQNFRLKFNSNDYLFQKYFYLLTVMGNNDSIQNYRLHQIFKDFWINDLAQDEYQLNLISTGKKIALPLIVSRRLLLNNLFWLLLVLIVFLAIYIIYLSQQEKYSLQQRLIGLELATLKSNLNPHFIFNIMNLVQSMIVRSEQKRALKAISELAKINRLFLETSDKELISVAEEIDFAKKYISLEQLRFEVDKPFTFKVNVEHNIELHNWLLPPLIVQPLLENALKHGVLIANNHPTMGITISMSNPYTLSILIYNSLPETKKRKSDGTNLGIHLVSERIKWVNEKYSEIQAMKLDVLPILNNEFQVLISIIRKDNSWIQEL